MCWCSRLRWWYRLRYGACGSESGSDAIVVRLTVTMAGRSERAVRSLIVLERKVGYQSRLAVRDAPALAAMQDLAGQHARFGYRRIRVFLKRASHEMSADRTHRLWRQAGLPVPRRRPRRRYCFTLK